MADQEKHIFEAKLFQVARVHTETFEIEAANEKEAQNRAEAIAKDKGITEKYDFEISDLTAQSEQLAQEDPAVAPEPEAR